MLTTAASQAVPNATPARWSRADRSSEISVAVPFDGVGPYPLIENGSLQTVDRRTTIRHMFYHGATPSTD
jgi:hypothetical protein